MAVRDSQMAKLAKPIRCSDFADKALAWIKSDGTRRSSRADQSTRKSTLSFFTSEQLSTCEEPTDPFENEDGTGSELGMQEVSREHSATGLAHAIAPLPPWLRGCHAHVTEMSRRRTSLISHHTLLFTIHKFIVD